MNLQPPSDAVLELARSSNRLGCDLYRRLCRTLGNLVMSPASITAALTMTWAGARGETAAQMREVLHLEGSADEISTLSGRLLRSLQDPSSPVILRVANRIFGETTYKLVPAYVDLTRETFDAPVELVDFIGAPEPSRAHINHWVEEKIERRIQDLIPAGAIDPDTRLVLVNAIYFLGTWQKPFPERTTHPEPFFVTPSRKKNVPTMHRTDAFFIAHTEGLTALELPYEGGRLSMVLLVPDQLDGLAALESTLDARRLDEITSGMRREHVVLALPKFEANPTESMSLNRDLGELGMPAAFDRGHADFTGIANPPDRADRLFISEVFHKGFVRVDEKGTEAAAATAVTMSRAGGAEAPPQIKVDRPFLFLVRDRSSGLVLFLGRVTDPSQA
jgi:serpin B